MTFNVLGEALSSKYLKDFDIIDDFVGNALWRWGVGTSGQIGDNTTSSKSSPVQTVAAGTNWKLVSSGQYNSIGIKTDGTLWIWGDNSFGQMGTMNAQAYSSPVQTVAAGTNWKQASCSNKFFNGAVKTDGTLWMWGFNNRAQCGDNGGNNRSSPVQTAHSGTNWKLVSCGGYHAAAVKTDGTLWAWGYGAYGQMGNNTTVSIVYSPIQTVAAGTNWKLVSCGQYFTTAIKTDGTLWGWGDNGYGQLGDNAITSRASPVQTVSAGTNWKSLSAGQFHTAAIKTDGTLWLWGLNSNGQLGDNTTTSRSSPVQTVSGGANWKQVACGLAQTAAIKTDGTLWSWGNNLSGQLGNNTAGAGTDKSSPVQTIAAGTNWKQVSSSAGCAAITFSDLQ